MLEFINNNWVLLLVVVVLALDKIVTVTPCKWDDLIWTSIKGAISQVFPSFGKKVGR